MNLQIVIDNQRTVQRQYEQVEGHCERKIDKGVFDQGLLGLDEEGRVDYVTDHVDVDQKVQTQVPTPESVVASNFLDKKSKLFF